MLTMDPGILGFDGCPSAVIGNFLNGSEGNAEEESLGIATCSTSTNGWLIKDEPRVIPFSWAGMSSTSSRTGPTYRRMFMMPRTQQKEWAPNLPKDSVNEKAAQLLLQWSQYPIMKRRALSRNTHKSDEGIKRSRESTGDHMWCCTKISWVASVIERLKKAKLATDETQPGALLPEANDAMAENRDCVGAIESNNGTAIRLNLKMFSESVATTTIDGQGMVLISKDESLKFTNPSQVESFWARFRGRGQLSHDPTAAGLSKQGDLDAQTYYVRNEGRQSNSRASTKRLKAMSARKPTRLHKQSPRSLPTKESGKSDPTLVPYQGYYVPENMRTKHIIKN